jgi:hypothetical protein
MQPDQLAAIKGTFSDFRLVKGRKVCQLVIEIPIEEAEQAIQVLGMPQPMTERWVALALLETKPKPEKEKADTKLSFEAVKRCKDPVFWKFIEDHQIGRGFCKTEEDAVDAVRWYCGVGSRGGLNTDQNAARHWRELDAKFLAWRDGIAA